MKEKRKIDLSIFVCSSIVYVVSLFYLNGYIRWLSCGISMLLTVVFFLFAVRKKYFGTLEVPILEDNLSMESITELALLNEERTVIATWEMYGKTSLVIGRDIGENQVSVNLNGAVFSSMIDKEHAVLNYSAGRWYVEDMGSKNGVSIVKPDGKKYRLSPDKPCVLEIGDTLCIAMTKLLLR